MMKRLVGLGLGALLLFAGCAMAEDGLVVYMGMALEGEFPSRAEYAVMGLDEPYPVGMLDRILMVNRMTGEDFIVLDEIWIDGDYPSRYVRTAETVLMDFEDPEDVVGKGCMIGYDDNGVALVIMAAN